MTTLPKILCLHGFVQSGPVLAAKTQGLRAAFLAAGYELFYLTAPVPMDSGITELADHRGWWLDDGIYDIDAGISAVKQCVLSEGPFVGVLGFSQGAALASALVAHPEIVGHAFFHFGIFFSGYRLDPVDYQWIYKEKVTVPTLHVWGDLDTVMEESQSQRLLDSCEEGLRTLLTHPGGHFVPQGKLMVDKIVKWTVEVSGKERE
ncbi:hypothetical protein BABINDRAFT_161000 [Babjeviella inositovora NRRL Y-12698]|uniref:Serine hydrolase domain-containing protein n=1 Tax=Babjeviella inositovora NRRL Y-12698 TaxID=984486 RepID=A0A1E3QT23_9ASCO|nr:uncharacterized protein BABINDRAFT_161000 [Babjeviella inositovora NRRL Y-12698]ODQ80788.1 hypothetical protein BABINDRAFT_161000 [Babjeviella inositovora NRRL Y-12698]